MSRHKKDVVCEVPVDLIERMQVNKYMQMSIELGKVT